MNPLAVDHNNDADLSDFLFFRNKYQQQPHTKNYRAQHMRVVRTVTYGARLASWLRSRCGRVHL